jgi:hypothetical protein
LKLRIYLNLGVLCLGWLSLGIGASQAQAQPEEMIKPVSPSWVDHVSIEAVSGGGMDRLSTADDKIGAALRGVSSLNVGDPTQLRLGFVQSEPFQNEPLAEAVRSLSSGPAIFVETSVLGQAPSQTTADPAQDDDEVEANEVEAEDDLPEGDPELGVIQVRSPLEDPDLGILRIREQPPLLIPPPRPPTKTGFLTARLLAGSSDNILLLVDELGGLTGDVFFRPSLTLGIYPLVGPETSLIGTLDVGLQRYGREADINYDDIRLRAGIRQGLSARSYGQLTFAYQQLFRPGPNRFRFFDNTAISLTLGRRDPLTPQLTLDTYYQAQYNDARVRSNLATGSVTTDFSRFSQAVGGYLAYNITPQLQTGLGYQLNLVNYTTQDRHDTFQQVIGQIAYNITPVFQVSLYGGVGFGRSSEPRVNFDSLLFGINLEANVPLF